MERTVTSYADDDDLLAKDCPNNAVNLRLIATTPEQMRQLVDSQAAKERSEKSELEADSATDGQDGAPATECDDKGWVPLLLRQSNREPSGTVGQAQKKRLHPAR
jgi:hypothetical protein